MSGSWMVHLPSGDSEQTQISSHLWSRTTPGSPAISEPSKIKLPAQVGTGASRPKRWFKVTQGLSCCLYNKLALWFWPPPLPLAFQLSIRWHRTQGGTTTLKGPAPPCWSAALGFQTAHSHLFEECSFTLLNKTFANPNTYIWNLERW